MDLSETAYLAKIEEVFRELDSSEEGLSSREVQKRLSEFGFNKIQKEKKITPFQIFFSQFKSPLVYILILAGTITLFLGEITDAFVIWSAILIDIVVGFIQEYKANDALDSLRKTISPKATVRRKGILHQVNSEEIVPGDVLVLKIGDKVSADARIFRSINLEIDESSLTGESSPQSKNSDQMKERTLVADRNNMVYMGTNIVSGTCEAVVIRTGLKTELGKISEFVHKEKNEKTFLQKELDKLAKDLSLILVGATLIVFLFGLVRGADFAQMFSESVALAIAGLPESLPVAVTVIFAIGMQKILKKKGLVKKLLATETLGRTEVICFDKTGTLTKGEMHVVKFEFLDESIPVDLLSNYKSNPFLQSTITTASVCNEAFLNDNKKYIGNPTDIALLKVSHLFGLDKEIIKKDIPLLDSLPFDSKRKFSANLLDGKRENYLYVVGAPEIILEKCTKVVSFDKSNVISLNSKDRCLLSQKNEEFGAEGYRVIACAMRDVSNKRKNINNDLSELTFLSFIIISDPLRESAKETINRARNAGVKLVMVTGDQKKTAVNIAKDVGLDCDECNVITGSELSKLSDDKLDKRIGDLNIICRVVPSDKVRIINSWRRHKKIVAMTGDGVNDAPALTLADIGIALGSGTEVAKESADLVLLNDDLKTILEAILEGRCILDNIKKVVTYLLSDSFAEIFLVGFSIVLGYPIPILPAQILWVNLVEDGLPDIALASEPTEKDVMKISPASYKRPILDKEVKTIVFIISWLDDIVLIGLFFFLYLNNYPLEYIRTMIFGVLAIDSLFFAFSCKSLRKPIWRINLWNNRLLNISFLFGIFMLVGSIYLPFLQHLLKTVSLTLSDWGILFLIGSIDLFSIELVKEIFIHRHYWKNNVSKG